MKKILIVLVALGIALFTWWTVSPLFITTIVEDELPADVQALLDQAPAVQEKEETPATITQDTLITNDNLADFSKRFAEEEPVAETSAPAAIQIEIAPAPVAATPAVQGPYTIESTPGHTASGAVRVIKTPNDGTIVRYENYAGTNGPDLFVYLAKDLDATEFVNLGRAKGNQGNINYTLPEDTDLSEYQYIMTWCKAFGVLFDYAEIK
ncbi:MAG: hypothetical protein ACI9H6_000093 [Patiriisocius sp.]|jgi:hypothetical protein